jgi:hypothetical protein
MRVSANQKIDRIRLQAVLNVFGKAASGPGDVGDPDAQPARSKALVQRPSSSHSRIVDVAINAAQHFSIGGQAVDNVERTNVSGMPDFVGLCSMGEDSVV